MIAALIPPPLNKITQFAGFYISYNPSVSDYGCDTTAIVTDDMGDFYVMRGDLRRELCAIAAAQGYKACIEFFDANPALQHSKDLREDLRRALDAAEARKRGQPRGIDL
jgi:hypothetical protein